MFKVVQTYTRTTSFIWCDIKLLWLLLKCLQWETAEFPIRITQKILSLPGERTIELISYGCCVVRDLMYLYITYRRRLDIPKRRKEAREGGHARRVQSPSSFQKCYGLLMYDRINSFRQYWYVCSVSPMLLLSLFFTTGPIYAQ